jgi:hypothetical protein
MASDELQIVNELLEGVDLGGLTLQERRAFFAAAAAPPPAGTTVDAVDADGVPAEWVTAAGVTGQRAVLFFPGGAYHVGSLATLRHLVALVSDAAQARVLNAGYRLAPSIPSRPPSTTRSRPTAGCSPAASPLARSRSPAIPPAGGWRSPCSWRCATPVSRCPLPPWPSHRGPTWK